MFNSKSNLPRRIDSLSVSASSEPKFNEIEDELRDVRRVHTHGQEEDLKMALSRMISRVEELSSLLKEAYKVQADLQTELTLAKSNLQLALANNEMLEDALNRDVPGSSKDVGWRRWGAKEQKERELEGFGRRSMDSSHSVDVINPSPVQSPVPSSTTPAEGRFFKFRFGNGGAASATGTTFPSPRLPASPRITQGAQSASVNGQFHSSHLTSASLPSLVPDREKEIETLTAELEKERKAHRVASTAKDALEAELESLSQALFEEANKMVATERMKLAETVDELREAEAEREALRSALKLMESQRRSSMRKSEDQDDPLSSSLPSLSLHMRSMSAASASSAIAIKSPPSFSAPSSPMSARRLLPDPPPSASTVMPTPTSALVQSHTGGSASTHSSETSSKPPSQSDSQADSSFEEVQDDSVEKENSSGLSSLDVASPSPVPSSPSPSPHPSPSPSGFVYVGPRPVVFYESDTESPWA